MISDSVPEAAALARVWGAWGRPRADARRDALAMGGECTLQHDAAYGFGELVDIAVRAVSTGTHHPTTGVQVDRIHDSRRLCISELGIAGEGQHRVVRPVRFVLGDPADVSPPARDAR